MSRCAPIVTAVWECLQDDKGEIPPLKNLAESAANEGSSTMAYIANKLSRADAPRAERYSAPAVHLKYAHMPCLAVSPYSSVPSSIRILSLRTSSSRCVCGTGRVEGCLLTAFCTQLHHQRPFINNVYKQGWSAPQAAVPSDGDLDEAYALYPDFLDRVIHIQRREPGWQDDLIWHTHQLMLQTYRYVLLTFSQIVLPNITSGSGPSLWVIFTSTWTTSPKAKMRTRSVSPLAGVAELVR